MFHNNINKNREEVYITPVALAINIGDYAMLDALLGYFKSLNVD